MTGIGRFVRNKEVVSGYELLSINHKLFTYIWFNNDYLWLLAIFY